MSAIILGDPHLGKNTNLGKIGLGATLNSRVIDQVNLLNWTLEQAIEHYIQDIIITGDIFEEPRPHPSLISLLVDWLKKCETNNINVHIIIGNHDIFRTGNYYTSPLDIITYCELQNVKVYNEITTIYLDDVAFTLIPFRDRKSFNTNSNVEALSILDNQLVYEAASIPLTYTKVVVGHLALEGSIPVGDEIDDLSNELMCPLDMFHSYDYVWMGHVHKPQVLQKSSPNKPYIAHIGSMDISNFGETDQEKQIIIFNSDQAPFFQYQVIPTRPLKKIIISIPKETHDTTQFVINELKQSSNLINKSILRLEIHLTSSELLSVDRTIIEKTLYQMGVHSVSAISESKKLMPLKKEGQQNLEMSMNTISAIKTYATVMIDKSQQNNFIKLALEIYDQYQQDIK